MWLPRSKVERVIGCLMVCILVVLVCSVVAAYEAAMFCMATLNRTGAKLMRKHGKQVELGVIN